LGAGRRHLPSPAPVRQGERPRCMFAWTGEKKNEQCDGGTRTALIQRGGKLSGSQDAAGGGNVPGAAGVGDPLTDHARTGGVVVIDGHNVPAAKPKLSVETLNWAPGQPRRGLFQSSNAEHIRLHPHGIIDIQPCAISVRFNPEQILRRPGKSAEALGNPSAATGLSGARIGENTHCVSSRGVAVSSQTRHRCRCSHRSLTDASCHDLPGQHLNVRANSTVGKVASRTGEVD
jgi:hypothetical protein